MKFFIILLLITNLLTLTVVIDQGISLAHLESSESFSERREHKLLLDIANLLLCTNSFDASRAESMDSLEGTKLYFKQGAIFGVGFKGEPEPQYTECSVTKSANLINEN